MDTIFALASAPGKSGVAVMRISGPDAIRALDVFGAELPVPGRGVRKLIHHGDVLDEAFCLSFPEGRSFTGEPVVELHLHGSVAVVSRVSDLLSQSGFRMAEPGEFSRRAFENGRLDLAQVEGLADLIDAETEAQRRQAVRALSGVLGDRAAQWRDHLQSVAVMFSAGFDFSDEDIPEDLLSDAAHRLDQVISDLQAVLQGSAAAERIRSGFDVVILGAPNVGKSTLLNRLAGREAAITSKIAGTTRDVIEVRMDLGGLPVTLVDTAGLRETSDEVESIGIDRARVRADNADLRVVLVEEGQEPEFDADHRTVICRAKADSGDGVSGLTGAGVDDLVSELRQRLGNLASNPGIAMRARQRTVMTEASEVLSEARDILTEGGDEVIAADLVQEGMRKLDQLIGKVDVETILGDIFGRFCIGK